MGLHLSSIYYLILLYACFSIFKSDPFFVIVLKTFVDFRSEWKKILSGNFGGPLTLKMIEVGLAPYIGLPKEPNVEQMEKVWNEIQVKIWKIISTLN